MIDTGKLKYNGKLNSQKGLHFYFKENGHALSFLIETIGDRRKKITVRVDMQPDVNHAKPHVHIGTNHNASFDINTGKLIIGKCDSKTQKLVETWIGKHKKDLLELWRIAKEGKPHQHVVDKIRTDKEFKDFGFKGQEPQNKEVINGVLVWYNGQLKKEKVSDNLMKITGDGEMYVGIPADCKADNMIFESEIGALQKKKLP